MPQELKQDLHRLQLQIDRLSVDAQFQPQFIEFAARKVPDPIAKFWTFSARTVMNHGLSFL
jgi:hypothetical protein